jgi:hypothetical protein
MEKLVYAVWRRPDETPIVLRDRLMHQVASELKTLGAASMEISAADLGAEEAGLPEYGRMRPLPDGLISFWLTSAYRRAPLEDALTQTTGRIAGYLVAEGTILPNRSHPAAVGQRVWGFSQVAFLRLKVGMAAEAWRRHWVDVQTQVAIETQSTFRYIQNVVVEALTPAAPAWVGIVEESFPMAALRDQRLYFDAVDSEERFIRNAARMKESVDAFLDPDGVDLIRTSLYPMDEKLEPGL